MKTKFSVLLSVYRGEKPEFFDESLASVYNQTIAPDEVLICKDGKLTLELEKTIDKYAKKYSKITKVVAFEENRGLGPTLRDGINACKNDIIFRMDSDDVSSSDRFEKQLRFMKDENADVVGSNIAEFDQNMKEHVGNRCVPEYDSDIKEFAKRRNPFNHMTVCFKKSAVQKAGNYEKMEGFEDYYLWVKMAQNGAKFYNIQENLVKVRGGNEMIMRRGGKNYLKNVINFEKRIQKDEFITKKLCYENIALRTLVLSGPNFARREFYYRFLRNHK